MKTNKVTKRATNERKTMGLAASQARLLTITARKADCEFMSMTLSHQKLALSRDMERVSTEYQNALTKTKLVYDYYGSADKQTDLTYNLLMNPSIYNDYLPKLVTDPTNRVILNSSYAAAARAAGIPAEGLDGLPSSDVRDAFVDALLGEGIITEIRANSIKNVPYNNTTGVGGTGVSATVATEEITYDELIERIKANCNAASSMNLSFGTDAYSLTTSSGSTKVSEGNEKFANIPKATGTYTDVSGQDLTLEMLLDSEQNYIISGYSRPGDQLPLCMARAMQEKIVGTSTHGDSFLNWMVDQFTTVLGGIPANDNAIQYAYNAVYDLIVPNNDIERDFTPGRDTYDNIDAGPSRRADTYCGDKHGDLLEHLKAIGECERTSGKENWNEDQAKRAIDFMGFYFTEDKDNSWLSGKNSNDHSQISISLSNLAKAFITSYIQFMDGIDDSKFSWQKGKKDACTLYNPLRDKDVKFIVSGETTVDDGDSYLYAAFYDTLFNRICINGWTENDKIDDKDYMQELIKNGQAFISSMSDDGFYYQGNYAADRTILEVADDEAIARAQAKYNTEKTRIEYKENRIDLKMKNLDTEISSLTTEYDSTKQLVTKTVEKSFKRYEA